MSLNMLTDPYISTVMNLVKSVETCSLVYGFGGNSTTANNSGISGFLPLLSVQYSLTVRMALAGISAFDTSLFCKLDILASILRLLGICRFSNGFRLNDGVLVLCLIPIRVLFIVLFAKAMFHQTSSLFVTDSKIETSVAFGAQNNCIMGSLWKDNRMISIRFIISII